VDRETSTGTIITRYGEISSLLRINSLSSELISELSNRSGLTRVQRVHPRREDLAFSPSLNDLEILVELQNIMGSSRS
jgi:hypothetical protein